MTSRDPRGQRKRQRPTNPLLQSYFSSPPAARSSGASNNTPAGAPPRPNSNRGSKQRTPQSEAEDINSPNFDDERYFKSLLRTSGVDTLLNIDGSMRKEIANLDGGMKTLVHNNYKKFILAADMIKQMKSSIEEMEGDLTMLKNVMEKVDDHSTAISSHLENKRTQIEQLLGAHSLMEQLQFLAETPNKLQTALDTGVYSEGVCYYVRTKSILVQYAHIPTFRLILERSEKNVKKIENSIIETLRNPDLSVIDSNNQSSGSGSSGGGDGSRGETTNANNNNNNNNNNASNTNDDKNSNNNNKNNNKNNNNNNSTNGGSGVISTPVTVDRKTLKEYCYLLELLGTPSATVREYFDVPREEVIRKILAVWKEFTINPSSPNEEPLETFRRFITNLQDQFWPSFYRYLNLHLYLFLTPNNHGINDKNNSNNYTNNGININNMNTTNGIHAFTENNNNDSNNNNNNSNSNNNNDKNDENSYLESVVGRLTTAFVDTIVHQLRDAPVEVVGGCVGVIEGNLTHPPLHWYSEGDQSPTTTQHAAHKTTPSIFTRYVNAEEVVVRLVRKIIVAHTDTLLVIPWQQSLIKFSDELTVRAKNEKQPPTRMSLEWEPVRKDYGQFVVVVNNQLVANTATLFGFFSNFLKTRVERDGGSDSGNSSSGSGNVDGSNGGSHTHTPSSNPFDAVTSATATDGTSTDNNNNNSNNNKNNSNQKITTIHLIAQSLQQHLLPSLLHPLQHTITLPHTQWPHSAYLLLITTLTRLLAEQLVPTLETHYLALTSNTNNNATTTTTSGTTIPFGQLAKEAMTLHIQTLNAYAVGVAQQLGALIRRALHTQQHTEGCWGPRKAPRDVDLMLQLLVEEVVNVDNYCTLLLALDLPAPLTLTTPPTTFSHTHSNDPDITLSRTPRNRSSPLNIPHSGAFSAFNGGGSSGGGSVGGNSPSGSHHLGASPVGTGTPALLRTSSSVLGGLGLGLGGGGLFTAKLGCFEVPVYEAGSIVESVVRRTLKTLMECVRLATVSAYGYQQLQIDLCYFRLCLEGLQVNHGLLQRMVDEVLSTAMERTVNPQPLAKGEAMRIAEEKMKKTNV